jgi:ParB family transcriptional regulator, chromosome partitioning protein
MARVPDIWPIERIRVENRYRRDLGDLTGLMESIREHGLINPVTVDESGRLLAGGRRLEAVKRLGYIDVQVHIIETLGDVLKELQVEEAENQHRKALTLSEKVRQGEAIRAVLAERAKERQRASGGDRAISGSHGAVGTGERRAEGTEGRASRLAREASAQTARALGMGGTNYRSIRAIQTVADNPDTPEDRREVAHRALREIDEGGSVQRITEEFRAGTYRRPDTSKSVPVSPVADEAAEVATMHHRTRARRIREQTERFDGLATQVVGMKMGIDGLLRDELPLIAPDMAKVAQWVSDLQNAKKAINDLVKRLKEITA